MDGRPRIGLLFGGPSVEHEVSVISARGVAAGLDRDRFECLPIGITGEGVWLPPEPSEQVLSGDASRVEGDASERLVADPSAGLVRLGGGRAGERLALDVVFSVVHGWGGEDGRIQGLLDLAGIPYVGSGVLGSAAAMDKEIAKFVFEARGLPVGPWRSLTREAFHAGRASVLEDLVSDLGLPLFVKPANGGSSVGVTRVGDRRALLPALEEAFRLDRKAVIEAALDAREIECAVLGNEPADASVPGEIVPSREFYDYAAKYLDGTSELRIPAPLSAEAAETVRRLALEAYRALDLAGLARVDFFVERETETVYVNEVNTLPGFTPISMYPKLWEATGLRYGDLLERLIRLALDRSAAERSRVSRR